MGGKGKKKVTVGYRYFMDIQAGLGRGPVDEIAEIRVDDKTVFAGIEGELSHSRAIYIDKPSLFGGDDTGGEGGIQGRLEVLMGESDQKPSGMLQNLINGVLNPNNIGWMKEPTITPNQGVIGKLIPGFRGIVSTVFSGLISCYSAYPKVWAYRVRRTSRGWKNNAVWYPAKLTIKLRNDNAQITGLSDAQIDNLRTIHAMNGAHILLECATNNDWGNGLELTDIHLDSYTAAADTLYSEGFGLCFRYNRQESLNTFVQQVLDHIGGVQYVDLETGKLTLRLIRNDYNPDELPVFTYDTGILSVQDDDSASTDNAPNEIIVTYHDPVMNNAGQARIQNLASIQAHGVISTTADYKAIPTYDLAARVGQRDLEMGSAGLTRLKIKFDRRGGQLAPAAVFRVNLPDRDIENMVMRVGRLTESDDGSFIIIAIQDVFGLPATNYNTEQPPVDWTPPDRTALPVANSLLMEVPYHILAADISPADLTILPVHAGFIAVCAQAPSSLSVNYLLQTRPAGVDYQDITTGDWTPSGVILEALGYFDSTLKVSLNVDFSLFVVGSAAVINTEIVRINAVNVSSGLISIGRGCADTLPATHQSGSMLWLYQYAEGDGVQYAAGETIDARLLTNTTTAQLAANKAPPLAVKMQQRQYRPYPPGNLKINGQPSRVIDDRQSFLLSWAHRDRLQQSDNLFEHSEGDIGPEPGTSYLIRLYRSNSLIRTITTTDNSFTYPDQVDETTQEPIIEDFDRVTLYSERDNVGSLQGYTLTVSGLVPPDLSPIILTQETLDSRVSFRCDSQHVYSGSDGLIHLAEPNQWPVEYIDGVAVGRHEPEAAAVNLFARNDIAPYVLGSNYQTAAAGTLPFSNGNSLKSYRYTIPTKQAGEAGNTYSYSVYLNVVSADKAITEDMHLSLVRLYTAAGYSTEIEKVTLQKLATGYYRVRLTFKQLISGNAYLRIWINYAYSDSYVFEVGAVQLEKGSYSSSFIPTSGSVATRSAAVVSISTQGATGCRVRFNNGDVAEHTFTEGADYELPLSGGDWGARYIRRIEYIK